MGRLYVYVYYSWEVRIKDRGRKACQKQSKARRNKQNINGKDEMTDRAQCDSVKRK